MASSRTNTCWLLPNHIPRYYCSRWKITAVVYVLAGNRRADDDGAMSVVAALSLLKTLLFTIQGIHGERMSQTVSDYT